MNKRDAPGVQTSAHSQPRREVMEYDVFYLEDHLAAARAYNAPDELAQGRGLRRGLQHGAPIIAFAQDLDSQVSKTIPVG
jgi:hypothetical protein